MDENKIISIEKRERQYFEEQVQRYRRSIKDAVCNAYQMQSSGFIPIEILEVKKILRETSRWFQVPKAKRLKRHAYCNQYV